MKESVVVTEKYVQDLFIAGIRFKGTYSDIGKYFGELYRKAGRYSKGIPFALYFDGTFKELDADIEAVLELRKLVEINGVSCRILPGGKVFSVLYKGSYEHIGDAYKQLGDYLEENGYEAKGPSREIYIKSFGMIFPRNPKNFVTEIQISV